jgi:citrate lyase beta subunit
MSARLNDDVGLAADWPLSARLGRSVPHPKQIALVKAAYAVANTKAIYYKNFVMAERAGRAGARQS